MKKHYRIFLVSMTGVLFLTLSGCAQVGSERWCNNMKDKAKADWTAGEAADFAKHCILK
ncbi:MAG: DUF3012 domain-containing protein [Candidatus Thiodiazotropha sp. (ex Semelilucina semeliformis)]|nr:DUF3012 domain-containing protein [Candidatus Thiodiazotropha sp. (ex Myrtea spinifera)]MCU7807340.1 DUF3012 domain-containing protein [Candidatus Thiodiazotropha sp. (ex Semelilucina semeliformis)]MCU7829962.1 DUF3012 domain-containing protein [Candidatus Thiodiazotropha sp. (ex Myrtea sp. 'scaly one' KF741663)]